MRARARPVHDPLHGCPARDRDAAAARDAVPAHVLRRGRVPAPADAERTPASRSKMWRARQQAIAEFRPLRPRVVVSVGGYASMPAVFAARKLHVPLVVVSYDRFPGRASALVGAAGSGVRRGLSRFAAAAGDADRRPGQAGDPRCRSRARPGVAARRARACPPTASRSSSSADRRDRACSTRRSRELLARGAGDRALTILHLAGDPVRRRRRRPRPTAPTACATSRSATRAAWRSCTRRADLLIGRGGASTVHEVAVTGTPAILVPWPGAAEDHQTANVRLAVGCRAAAMLVGEPEIDRLADVVDTTARSTRSSWRRSATTRQSSGRSTAAAPWPSWSSRSRCPAEAHARPSVAGERLDRLARRRSGRNLGRVVITASTPDLAAPARSRRRRARRAARPVAAPPGARDRRRWPGHERDRAGARRDGPRRVGCRHPRPSGARPPPGGGRHGPHRPQPVARHRVRRGDRLERDPERSQRARRGAQARHPDAVAGRACWPRSAPAPDRWRSPAPTARRPRRRC